MSTRLRRTLAGAGVALLLIACRGEQTSPDPEATPTAEATTGEYAAAPPASYMAPTGTPLPPERRAAPPRAMRAVFTRGAGGMDTLRECGQRAEWWVTGGPEDAVLDDLRRRSDALAERQRSPSTALYVEATGELMGADSGGSPAQDMHNVVRLSAVTRIDERIPADCLGR